MLNALDFSIRSSCLCIELSAIAIFAHLSLLVAESSIFASRSAHPRYRHASIRRKPHMIVNADPFSINNGGFINPTLLMELIRSSDFVLVVTRQVLSSESIHERGTDFILKRIRCLLLVTRFLLLVTRFLLLLPMSYELSALPFQLKSVPVSNVSACIYFLRVFIITSSGRDGAGGFLSQFMEIR